MAAPEPGSLNAQDQAPEVSLHQDHGPIPASSYTTRSLDYSPQYQQQDKPQTGFTPIQQSFLPQNAQPMETKAPPPPPTQPTKLKRKRLWPLALVVAALVALGAGIGIGYAVGDNNSSLEDSSSSANGTDDFVTSGNTGITAFSCDADATYASPFGSSFAQECFVSYKTNQTAYDNSSVVVKNFAGLTVYNFETCMDECVKRNRQLDIGNMLGDRCVAVSFYANLTYSIPAWAGNCFIKNAKGIGRNWDENSNASLTASAYMVPLH